MHEHQNSKDEPLQSPPHSPKRRLLIEVALVFVASLILTRVLSDLAGISALISEFLFTLVSAVFILIPYFILQRRNADFDAHALTWNGWPKAVGYAAALTLLTAAPFLVGYHVWQTSVLGRTFEVSTDNYWHLAPATVLEGRPNLKEIPQKPEVLLWRVGKMVHVRWSVGAHNGTNPSKKMTIALTADNGELHLRTGRSHATDPDVRRQGTPKSNIVLESSSHKPLYASFYMRSADTLQLRALLDNTPATEELMRLGPSKLGLDSVEESFDPKTQTLTFERGITWLPMLVLLQILLIALPEEFFYRGYLQTSLDTLTDNKRWKIGPLHLSPAILIASFLFGVGHFIINFVPTRMAVFFPSLLFGWLRDRTGTIVSCILYHAACNMLVEVASQHYL